MRQEKGLWEKGEVGQLAGNVPSLMAGDLFGEASPQRHGFLLGNVPNSPRLWCQDGLFCRQSLQ